MKKNFSEIRSALPEPLFDEHPEFIDLYWKAWRSEEHTSELQSR